jgi:tRNA nucleotidyltransferase (CCA-adding enzyme)
LTKHRNMKPMLNGEDLLRIGVLTGPELGKMLNLLLEARLDGEVGSREDEERFIIGMQKKRL